MIERQILPALLRRKSVTKQKVLSHVIFFHSTCRSVPVSLPLAMSFLFTGECYIRREKKKPVGGRFQSCVYVILSIAENERKLKVSRDGAFLQSTGTGL